MSRRKTTQKKKQTTPFWQNTMFLLVVVFLFLGSLVLFLMDDPEVLSLKSHNGVVGIEGRLIGSPEVVIDYTTETSGSTADLGVVYHLVFEEQSWMPEATLEFLAVGASDDVLWMYDAQRLAWIRRTGAVYDGMAFVLENERLSGESWWAIGEQIEREPSRYMATLLNELTAYPPEGAIAYEAFVTFASVEGDFVLIAEDYDRGGCDGALLTTTDVTMTSQEHETDEGIERVQVLWYLADGCVEGQHIESVD